MKLNYLNSVPLHKQLKQIIKERINDGIYINTISSEKKLMDEFHVSRSTVRQAIENLVQSVVVKNPW